MLKKKQKTIGLWSSILGSGTPPGLLILLACTVGLAPGCTRREPEKIPAPSGTVIARVNGKPIYEAQLKPELEATLQKFRKYGMQKDDPALIQRRQTRILDRLIGDELVYQESRKLTIDDLDARVEQERKALQAKYGTGDHFDRYLKSRQMTPRSLEEALRAKVGSLQAEVKRLSDVLAEVRSESDYLRRAHAASMQNVALLTERAEDQPRRFRWPWQRRRDKLSD